MALEVNQRLLFVGLGGTVFMVNIVKKTTKANIIERYLNSLFLFI